MKLKLGILLLTLSVVSTLHSADCETKSWPGWYSCQVSTARVRAVVNYSNMVAGQTVQITRELDNGGSFSFQTTGADGTYYSAYTSYAANCSTYGECVRADWTLVSVSAGIGATGSGGRPVTGLLRQDGAGPSSCVAVVVNDVDITYTVSKPPPVCNWSLGGSITGACATDEHVWSVLHDGVTVAGGSFTGSTNLNVSGSTGGDVMLAVDGNTAGNWTPVCSGDPPPLNSFIANVTVGQACTEPTPTPTPEPTSTPQPTATPITSPTATPPPTPTPGVNYPSPSPNPSTPPTNTTPGLPPPYNGGSGNPGSSPLNVYEDVRRALNDSGNQDTASQLPNDIFEYGEPDEKQQPTLDALADTKAQLEADKQKMQSTHELLKSRYSADKKPVMPTGIGTTLSWSVTLPVLGSFVIDISPFQTWITWIRNACLLVVYIQFWIWTSNTVRSAVA
jgi:hypothetical protein